MEGIASSPDTENPLTQAEAEIFRVAQFGSPHVYSLVRDKLVDMAGLVRAEYDDWPRYAREPDPDEDDCFGLNYPHVTALILGIPPERLAEFGSDVDMLRGFFAWHTDGPENALHYFEKAQSGYLQEEDLEGYAKASLAMARAARFAGQIDLAIIAHRNGIFGKLQAWEVGYVSEPEPFVVSEQLRSLRETLKAGKPRVDVARSALEDVKKHLPVGKL